MEYQFFAKSKYNRPNLYPSLNKFIVDICEVESIAWLFDDWIFLISFSYAS
jgi:hypothetical protein